MEQKKEKGLRIRSCLTGAIWLALVFSTVISALLFAILNHFFNLPGSIPVLGCSFPNAVQNLPEKLPS